MSLASRSTTEGLADGRRGLRRLWVTRLSLLAFVLILLSSGLAGVGLADPPPDGPIELVSAVDGSATSEGNQDSDYASISPNGRFVAFQSTSTNLVGDEAGTIDWDVFIRDTQGLTTVAVSRPTCQGECDSQHGSVTDDGRYVAFDSTDAGLVPADTNGERDVFVADLLTGSVIRVSISESGAQANGSSQLPSISGDGEWIAFTSSATNLVSNDDNGTTDVFLAHVDPLTFEVLSTIVVSAVDGTSPPVPGSGPAAVSATSLPMSDNVSLDGRYVTFYSSADDLVSPYNGESNIFRRDVIMDRTEVVDVPSRSGWVSNGSREPSISANGQVVGFRARSNTLGGPVTDCDGFLNPCWRVYVRDFQDPIPFVEYVPQDPYGDSTLWGGAVSAEGRYVTLESIGSPPDVFVNDRVTGCTNRVSVATDGTVLEAGGEHGSLSSAAASAVFTSTQPGLVPGVSGRQVFLVHPSLDCFVPPEPLSDYVAMGDSFQSGVGAGDYYAETDTDTPEPNHCKRSPHAYAPILFDAGLPYQLDFVACGGATISDITDGTVEENDAPYNEGAQIDHLTDETALVSIGIGGNDLGFGGAVKDCIIGHAFFPWAGSREGDLDDDVTDALLDLQTTDEETGLNRLELLYAELRLAAPNARILVLDYPRFFPSIESGPPALDCNFVRLTDQLWINYKILQLDRAIDSSARSVGMEPVQLYDASLGHELCNAAGTEDFLNGIVYSNLGDSFHPTAFGYADISEHVDAAINSSSPGDVVTVLPGETVTSGVMVTSGESISFSSSWPGSDVVMELTSPTGRTFNRETEASDVVHILGPRNEVYKILDPEPGVWTVGLFGADVPEEGEPTALNFFEWPALNEDPIGAISLTGTGPEVSVDATGSHDPDGSVEEYLWEFGDGTFATSSQATHTYEIPGTYKITLMVADDQGGLGFAAASQEIVIPESGSQLSDISDAHVWVGLKNSDDQGTPFDVQVELLTNGTPVAAGLQRCVVGVTRNPSLAKEVVVGWNGFTPVELNAGDVLALRVSTRIGTNPDGTKCSPGHNNALGLRLYYDAASRASRLSVTMTPDPSEDLYLGSDGVTCASGESSGVSVRFLVDVTPTANAAKCKDSGSINFAGGNVFREVGIWALAPLS